MSVKQEYSLDTLAILNDEINKIKDQRKNILSLDKILLQPQKDIIELIKSGCTAKDIANIFKTVQIKVGVAKIKKLYFCKKTIKTKHNQTKAKIVTPQTDDNKLNQSN